MRLAIYHNLPSGGAKKFLWGFVKRSAQRHQIDLYRLTDFDNESFCDLRPLVHRHFDYRAGVRPGSPAAKLRPLRLWDQMAAAEGAIVEDIDSRGYDAVFVQHCQFTTSPYLLRKLRTPALYYMQEPRRHHYERSHMPAVSIDLGRPLSSGKALRRRYVLARTKARDVASVRGATHLLCNSYYSLESIYRAYGRYPVVSYLGVDDGYYLPLPVPEHRRAVLTVGALLPSKAQLLLLDALSLMPTERRPSVDLVFDRQLSHYRMTLEQRARAAGIELRLHHRIDEEALRSLYRSSMATVCTSELEPFGLTPLESIACGTPVVAVREGGFRESVVDGVNGLLVDRDPSALAEAIDQVCAGGLAVDADVLRSSIIPKFSLDMAVDRLETHLARVADG